MSGIMRNKQKPFIKHGTKKPDKNANSIIHVHNFKNYTLKFVAVYVTALTVNLCSVFEIVPLPCLFLQKFLLCCRVFFGDNSSHHEKINCEYCIWMTANDRISLNWL